VRPNFSPALRDFRFYQPPGLAVIGMIYTPPCSGNCPLVFSFLSHASLDKPGKLAYAGGYGRISMFVDRRNQTPKHTPMSRNCDKQFFQDQSFTVNSCL
jgi:hypothetical protein